MKWETSFAIKTSIKNIWIKIIEVKHLKYLVLAYTIDIELSLAFVQNVPPFLHCFIWSLLNSAHTPTHLHPPPPTQNVFPTYPYPPKIIPHTPPLTPAQPKYFPSHSHLSKLCPNHPKNSSSHPAYQKYGSANLICSPLQNSSCTKSYDPLIMRSSNVTN